MEAHLWIYSCLFLSTTVVICCVGLVSPKYHDNLFQCLGMCALIIGCGSRIGDLWISEPVIPWDWFMVHAGVGLFSVGAFWHVFLRERSVRFAEFAHSVGAAWRHRPAQIDGE